MQIAATFNPALMGEAARLSPAAKTECPRGLRVHGFQEASQPAAGEGGKP